MYLPPGTQIQIGELLKHVLKIDPCPQVFQLGSAIKALRLANPSCLIDFSTPESAAKANELLDPFLELFLFTRRANTSFPRELVQSPHQGILRRKKGIGNI